MQKKDRKMEKQTRRRRAVTENEAFHIQQRPKSSAVTLIWNASKIL